MLVTRKSESNLRVKVHEGRHREASKRVQVDEQKTTLLKYLREGYTVSDACRIINKSPDTYKYYRRTDEAFRLEADRIISRKELDYVPSDAGDFPAFSEKYLKQTLFRHQLQWVDLLEGSEPRDLHPSQRFEAGDKNFVVINTPPEHSKSTTVTMNYVAYRICKDPSVRVIIVSKTQSMAKKFLNGIKQRLTSRKYQDLIQDFAPPEGFEKASGAVWRADQIYVGGDSGEGVAEKDPTVEAIGIGGQIYGARADLIILDDCVTLDNVGQVEGQIEWVQQEVMSRLGAFGRLIVVGTRVASTDLYTELLNGTRYVNEKSPWTYLSQPAVLELGDEPKDWVTLWPRSNMPMKGDTINQPDEDGLYPFWTGSLMGRVRDRVAPRTWAMVYMQQQVDEMSVFPAEDVQGCVDGYRPTGQLHSGREGGGTDKGSDWYMIAGMDPASTAGFTACTVLAFNRRTHQRRVIEVHNARMTPQRILDTIKEVTVRLKVAFMELPGSNGTMRLARRIARNRRSGQPWISANRSISGGSRWSTDSSVQ